MSHDAVATATPDDDDEIDEEVPTVEIEAPEVDVTQSAEDREWIDCLNRFLTKYTFGPIVWEGEEHASPISAEEFISPSVRAARDRAICAAFNKIAELCKPQAAPFLLDCSRFGRDE